MKNVNGTIKWVVKTHTYKKVITIQKQFKSMDKYRYKSLGVICLVTAQARIFNWLKQNVDRGKDTYSQKSRKKTSYWVEAYQVKRLIYATFKVKLNYRVVAGAFTLAFPVICQLCSLNGLVKFNMIVGTTVLL